MRFAGYLVLCFLSLAVAGYAVGVYGLLPLGALVHPEMRVAFEAERVAIYAHIFGAAFALALGPLQFSVKLRRRRPNVHRWLGRTYLGIGVLVGGVAGFVAAFNAFGGVPARIGFAALALAWLYTGACAYRAIRAGNIASHRRWMIRNFSLTFAAVTLRIWLPSSMVLGIDAVLAYQVIAWLCWVPNLLVAELVFNRSSEAPRTASDFLPSPK
jgi:uncharacterized membrane protein